MQFKSTSAEDWFGFFKGSTPPFEDTNIIFTPLVKYMRL